MADALRGSMDAAEYKHVALGLLFLKYISDAFEEQHGHVLTPGRYVGSEAQADDGEPFEKKMRRLTAQLQNQLAESTKLDDQIRKNLRALGYDI